MKEVISLSYVVLHCLLFEYRLVMFITEIKGPYSMSDKRSKVPVTIRFDPELLEFLKEEAEKRGETISNYIRSSAVMRLTGELVPAERDNTKNAYLRSRGIR